MTSFVSRAEWGARPPKSTPAAIVSRGTTAHWEGPNLWGAQIGPHSSCASKVRGIQAYHMDQQGWSDIAYNAVACPHDYVFEGRGPGRRSAANGTNSANEKSCAVCYLGGEGDEFTEGGRWAMLWAAGYLLAPLVWCHRDHYATACAGDVICGWVHAGAPAPGPVPVPEPPDVPEDTMVYWMEARERSDDGSVGKGAVFLVSEDLELIVDKTDEGWVLDAHSVVHDRVLPPKPGSRLGDDISDYWLRKGVGNVWLVPGNFMAGLS